MCCCSGRNSVMAMTPSPSTSPSPSSTSAPSTTTVNWLLACALSVVALIRPVVRIIATQAGYELSAAVPVLLTLGITVVWVVAVVSARTPSPVLTLMIAGVVYAVLSTVLSGVLSPIPDGEFSGPLANPVAIFPMLLINAGWGLVAGGIALTFRRRVSPTALRRAPL